MTAFCTQMTGITQATVDAAEPIDAVLKRWLPAMLGTDDVSGVLPVTCGEPDLKAMLPRECARKGLQVPPVFRGQGMGTIIQGVPVTYYVLLNLPHRVSATSFVLCAASLVAVE